MSGETGDTLGVGGDAGVWTIPNLISVIRIAAIPVFLWVLLVRDEPGWAAVLLGAIAWTDFFDGWAARRLGQVSEIGKFLDPLADRLVVVASLVGGLAAGLVPAWLVWPLLARETLIGLATLYAMSRLGLRVVVRPLGKAATALVFLAVPLYYLTGTGIVPGFWPWPAAVIGSVGLGLYLVVSWQYLGDMRLELRARPTRPRRS